MRIAYALARLTRIDSSLLVALAVFVPLFVRTRDFSASIGKAIPLLFIGMCTFIANDLDDVEKDRINHPERPLPSGSIAPSFAAMLYFTCLGAALFTTKFCVPGNLAFWYYSLLTASISYGYVVNCFPGLKSFYVACAISVPVLTVAISYPLENRLYFVVAAVFFFVLGRELCMDFADRAGDATSFMHRLQPLPLSMIAFSSQLFGFALLTLQAKRAVDAAGLLLIASLLSMSGYYWFKLERYKAAIFLMKLQLVIGLCFLA